MTSFSSPPHHLESTSPSLSETDITPRFFRISVFLDSPFAESVLPKYLHSFLCGIKSVPSLMQSCWVPFKQRYSVLDHDTFISFDSRACLQSSRSAFNSSLRSRQRTTPSANIICHGDGFRTPEL